MFKIFFCFVNDQSSTGLGLLAVATDLVFTSYDQYLGEWGGYNLSTAALCAWLSRTMFCRLSNSAAILTWSGICLPDSVMRLTLCSVPGPAGLYYHWQSWGHISRCTCPQAS